MNSLTLALLLILLEILALGPVCYLLRHKIIGRFGIKPHQAQADPVEVAAHFEMTCAIVSMHTRIENMLVDINRKIAKEPNTAQLEQVRENLAKLGAALRTGASRLATDHCFGPEAQQSLLAAQEGLLKIAKF